MKLTQINGNDYEIELTGIVKEHFDKPENYAEVVVNEFNANPFENIKPDSVILDIGANIGLFALHVMPHAKKMICVADTVTLNESTELTKVEP